MLQENLGVKEDHSLKHLLSRAQTYINYEENLLTEEGYREAKILGLNRAL